MEDQKIGFTCYCPQNCNGQFCENCEDGKIFQFRILDIVYATYYLYLYKFFLFLNIIILFYSCLSVAYTQQEDTACLWPAGKSGETFHSLDEAKTGCTAWTRGCTMFYRAYGEFSTCPVGSTVESYGGYTLYTAIGK